MMARLESNLLSLSTTVLTLLLRRRRSPVVRLIPSQSSEFVASALSILASSIRVHLSLLQRILRVHLVVTTRARTPHDAILKHHRVIRVVATAPTLANGRHALFSLGPELSIDRVGSRRALFPSLVWFHRLPAMAMKINLFSQSRTTRAS